MVKDREAGHTPVHGFAESDTTERLDICEVGVAELSPLAREHPGWSRPQRSAPQPILALATPPHRFRDGGRAAAGRRWRGGGGARTFGLVLVDLDALREELPGEHGGAGQHPGLPRHLVLLHRDLHRVHGWHERHGSSRRPPAHVPHAGLQPSQGGEAAAQSQAAGALVCPRRHPPPSSVSLPGSPAPTRVGSEFLGHSSRPALTAKPGSVPGRWGRAWPNLESIQTQVSKPVPHSVLDARPLPCSCKAITDSSLHRGEGMVPRKCMEL